MFVAGEGERGTLSDGKMAHTCSESPILVLISGHVYAEAPVRISIRPLSFITSVSLSVI